MDGPGNKFLAGTGLTEDADARFACSNAIDLREQFAHHRAGADQLMFAETVAEFAIFVFKAREF